MGIPLKQNNSNSSGSGGSSIMKNVSRRIDSFNQNFNKLANYGSYLNEQVNEISHINTVVNKTRDYDSDNYIPVNQKNWAELINNRINRYNREQVYRRHNAKKPDVHPDHEYAIQAFAEGYARPSRYLVLFRKPIIMRLAENDNVSSGTLSAASDDNTKKMSILAHTVSVPQKSFTTFEHRNLGSPYKIPYSVNFDPFTISFYCDARMEIKRFFDNWTNLIINPDNGVLSYYDDFITEIEVVLLDVENFNHYTVRLHEAYPISVSSLELSASAANTILNMSVTFSYKFWEEKK